MKIKKIVLALIFVLLTIFTIVLLLTDEVSFAIYSAIFDIFVALLLIKEIKLNSSSENYYNGTIKNILKTYDVILVEIENLPDIGDKEIIVLTGFNDIVNTQYECRKPVYYIHDDNTYDFFIITEDIVYIYSAKKEENIKSVFEKYIDEEKKQKENSTKQVDILENLENTTVIKLDNNKEYVVSPVKE